MVLLPHLGSATRETRIAPGLRAADNLSAFFAGEPPPDRLPQAPQPQAGQAASMSSSWRTCSRSSSAKSRAIATTRGSGEVSATVW